MKQLITALPLLLCLNACGLETATTAATVGVAKQQEIKQGQEALAAVESKVGDATAKSVQRLRETDAADNQ